MPAAVAVAVTVASTLAAAPDAHWSTRPECKAALQAVMAAEPGFEAELKRLRVSKDVALKACGVWLELPRTEVELSLEGPSEALERRRAKRILQVAKFAHHFRRAYPTAADLEVEARLRRVRHLVETGERTTALSEARRVKAVLKAREGPSTPTIAYVQGVTDLAVSQASWPLRMLLNMAGVSGDEKRGRKLLVGLAEGDSVYAGDALFLLHHFARENQGPDSEAAIGYGRRLNARFPDNPQFAYDLGVDLWRAERCEDALSALEHVRGRLEAKPDRWSSRVRAKLYWLTARCALDTKREELAQRYAELAHEQGFEELAERIEAVRAEL